MDGLAMEKALLGVAHGAQRGGLLDGESNRHATEETAQGGGAVSEESDALSFHVCLLGI